MNQMRLLFVISVFYFQFWIFWTFKYLFLPKIPPSKYFCDVDM